MENDRQARFFEITAAGRRQLEREKDGWWRMIEIMSRMLGEEG